MNFLLILAVLGKGTVNKGEPLKAAIIQHWHWMSFTRVRADDNVVLHVAVWKKERHSFILVRMCAIFFFKRASSIAPQEPR